MITRVKCPIIAAMTGTIYDFDRRKLSNMHKLR